MAFDDSSLPPSYWLIVGVVAALLIGIAYALGVWQLGFFARLVTVLVISGVVIGGARVVFARYG